MSNRETLYVLRRSDGSVYAELLMTPAMAKKVNRSRKADIPHWEPQPLKQYGLWHLDKLIQVETMTEDRAKLFNSALPEELNIRWIEEEHDVSERTSPEE